MYRLFYSPLLFLCSLLCVLCVSPAYGEYKGVNHLAKEKSPYLLQHKNNPVWWFAWGDDAFATARKLNRPILLSVGYSTCHWCHVMEHESFENSEVAAFLNKHFVAIKVDREERPDVDQVYMKAVHALKGRGGWPMTIMMTPEGKPFFGGTYYPKARFMQLLKQMANTWEHDRQNLESKAQSVAKRLSAKAARPVSSSIPDAEVYDLVLETAQSRFDSAYGGFGRAPKFPPSTRLQLLLRLMQRESGVPVERIVTKTLSGMARKGMYDHLGGGFHRYSTDRQWGVPHFEKMLYDNALLSKTYLEVYQVLKKPWHLDVARETLDYVLRQMTHADGGFYSAEDADSEGEEGTFYVWSMAELKKVLSKEELKQLSAVFEITEQGNFEKRSNILWLRSGVEWSKREELTPLREKLRRIRAKRERPLRDDKILTAWNGLMIDSMSIAYRVTEDERYREAAEGAARFLKKHLWDGERLYRRYRDGERSFSGVLDDYAYLIRGLISLYMATYDEEWIVWARELQDVQDKLFWDAEGSGYFYSSAPLIVRTKEYHDSARPNANGYATLNLLQLYGFTFDRSYYDRALLVLNGAAPQLARYPFGFGSLMLGLDYLLQNPKEVAVVTAEKSSEDSIVKYLRETFLPHAVISVTDTPRGEEGLPILARKVLKNKKTTAYICQDSICKAPTNDLRQIKALLGDK